MQLLVASVLWCEDRLSGIKLLKRLDPLMDIQCLFNK